MKLLIIFMLLVACGSKRDISKEMDVVFHKATAASLKYRNYTTIQLKLLLNGDKDSAQLYEDSAKFHYNEYFSYMKEYDSLQSLFKK